MGPRTYRDFLGLFYAIWSFTTCAAITALGIFRDYIFLDRQYTYRVTGHWKTLDERPHLVTFLDHLRSFCEAIAKIFGPWF